MKSAAELIDLRRPPVKANVEKLIEQENTRSRNEIYKRLLSESSVPLAYWHLIKRHDGQSESQRTAFDILRQHVAAARVGILGITGPPRSGKSCLAVRLMDHWMWKGMRCSYTTPVRFIAELMDAGKSDDSAPRQNLFQRWSQPWLLVLDDFQNRSESSWERTQLNELIERRWATERWTLLVFRGTPKQLITSVDPAFQARMAESGGIINCK